MSSMTRPFGSAIWFLACCGFALGGEAVTVQGKIEKVDATERRIVISPRGSDEKIELELTRKTTIKRDGKEDVGLDTIKAGETAKIKYDSELLVAALIELGETGAVGTARVLNLEELNTDDNEFHTWLSEDGLTIYWAIWPGPNNWIWSARRMNSTSVFEDKIRLFRGHSPVVSADGTETIFGSPDSAQLLTTTRNTAEGEFRQPTVIRELVFGEKEIPAPRWLSKDGLTLFLEKNGPEKWISDIWFTTREKKTSAWKALKPVPISIPGRLRLSQPCLTPDDRRMLVTVQEESSTVVRLGLLERKDKSKPFSQLQYLDLRDEQGPLPQCFMPRYVAATQELFLVSRFLFRSDEQSKQKANDLWVIKDFQLPSSASAK